jgi:glycerol-3-phosphate dehydrogenase
MPISEAVYRVCHEGAAIAEEATRLMTRERKDELAGIFQAAR